MTGGDDLPAERPSNPEVRAAMLATWRDFSAKVRGLDQRADRVLHWQPVFPEFSVAEHLGLDAAGVTRLGEACNVWRDLEAHVDANPTQDDADQLAATCAALLATLEGLAAAQA